MNPVTIEDCEVVDLLTRRLEKSVQATCRHANERIIGARSGYPSDTAINTFFCPECERYRTEELTISEMAALEDEAKGRTR